MKKRCAGYSLVEVLVAMTLLAIVSVAIARLMVYSTATIPLNAQSSQAITFAEKYLEDLRRQDYTSLASGSATEVWNGVTFTVVWTVTANSPAAGMKTVAVTVSWTHKGKPQSYATSTVYTQLKG